MLNRSGSLAMSISILKALPGKPDIKRHSPSILYLHSHNPVKMNAHSPMEIEEIIEGKQQTRFG